MADLLVQKPQFNTQVLCPGTAIQFCYNRGTAKTGVITDATPLRLSVTYYVNGKTETDDECIEIDELTGNRVTIQILKPLPDKDILEKSLKSLVSMIQQTTHPKQEIRGQVTVLARMLGLDPENIKPDWLKEDSLLNE